MKILSYQYPKSSFLSIEKDTVSIVDTILKNDRLKKLLYYTSKDALLQPNLTDEQSQSLLQDHTETLEDGNTIEMPSLIRLVPKIYVDEAEVNYIVISFDNFFECINNPEFRDCTVQFDILCHYNLWKLNDMQLRPYKIAAEIDSMFNNQKLSGIGTLLFAGATAITVQGQEYAGIKLMYSATHGEDDKHWFDNEDRPSSDDDLEDNFDKIFNNK